MRLLLTTSIFTLLLTSGIAFAGESACPVKKTKEISLACREEIQRLVHSDTATAAITDAVKKSLDLTNCRLEGAEKVKWKYTFWDATGPFLDVSTWVYCDGPGYDGYQVQGYFFVDENKPSFQFIGLKTSTFE